MQVKLLRAIQEKSVRKVGSNQEVNVDVRLLSATHKNLKIEMEENRFRGDLFYRINVIEIHVPSLRERNADIPLLADQILRQLADEWQLAKPKLSDDAIDAAAIATTSPATCASSKTFSNALTPSAKATQSRATTYSYRRATQRRLKLNPPNLQQPIFRGLIRLKVI